MKKLILAFLIIFAAEAASKEIIVIDSVSNIYMLSVYNENVFAWPINQAQSLNNPETSTLKFTNDGGKTIHTLLEDTLNLFTDTLPFQIDKYFFVHTLDDKSLFATVDKKLMTDYTHSYLLKTTDMGSSWDTVNVLEMPNLKYFVMKSGITYFGFRANTVYHSKDSCKTIDTLIKLEIPGYLTDISDIEIVDTNRIYLVAYDPHRDGYRWLVYTENGGKDWTIKEGPEYYLNYIFVDSKENIYLSGVEMVYNFQPPPDSAERHNPLILRSTDKGDSWEVFYYFNSLNPNIRDISQKGDTISFYHLRTQVKTWDYGKTFHKDTLIDDRSVTILKEFDDVMIVRININTVAKIVKTSPVIESRPRPRAVDLTDIGEGIIELNTDFLGQIEIYDIGGRLCQKAGLMPGDNRVRVSGPRSPREQ